MAGKRRRGGFTQVQALVLRQVRQSAGEGALVFLEQAAAGILQQTLDDGERPQFRGAGRGIQPGVKRSPGSEVAPRSRDCIFIHMAAQAIGN